MAKGRKRKAGARSASGRLKDRPCTALDRGNHRIEFRLDLYRCFDKTIKNEDVDDGPGQAFVAGLFDNGLADPKAMRDIARDYADLYWGYYSAQRARVGGYEPRSRTSQSSEIPCATARELRFQRLDEMMPLSSIERQMMHELCVDHWGSDFISPTLQRLIDFKFALKGRQPVGIQVAGQVDWDRWERIKDVLIEMVQGSQQRRAA